MFNLAHGYARRQMSAFVELQEAEFAAADKGFTAVKHQREVGTGYFDAVTQTIQGAQSSTVALKGSTEEEQFQPSHAAARVTRHRASPARRAAGASAHAAILDMPRLTGPVHREPANARCGARAVHGGRIPRSLP